ncbi:MAG: serine hydrolase [Ruminococcaceae bacterium]|nr:serine hydrolase [Oscillospiraceae bacterium]
MESYKKKSIKFLVNLSLKEQKDPRVVKYTPSKISTSGKEDKYFSRKIGGEGGKYASLLTSMLKELEKEERANVHSIMVFKDGAVVAEASRDGYDANVFHLAHSMSKTVTGLAIGFLYDESRINLNALAIDFFPEIKRKGALSEKITVRDLLSMKSGVKFAEVGVVSEVNWTQAFFESASEFVPSERFKYNSMNSYILANIVTRITGKSLSEYVNEKLFEPLGIKNYLWEKGPEGIEKGGFGLYLSCESFLKIGAMMASGGYFNNKRILSREFLSLMLTPHADVSHENPEYDYGLHVWVSRDGNEFLLNGMLGQNVWISKSSGFIVSMNSGNNELFTQSPALAIIKKHLSVPDNSIDSQRRDVRRLKETCDSFFSSREDISKKEEKRGIAYFLGIKNRYPFDTGWDDVLGEYAFRDNNASLLPLFVRTMQNNFLGGIEKISLLRITDSLILTVKEGDTEFKIPVGLYNYSDTVLNFGGEKYLVRALGECALDEDKNKVYKIKLIFPELPNTRMIKISHAPEGISLKMSEYPNEKIAETFFDSITNDSKTSFAISFVEKKMGSGFFKSKINSTFNPTLSGINTKNPGWESIIINDNLRLAEQREKSSSFITSLISKFLIDKDEEKEKAGEGGIKGFFAKALSLLFEKLQQTDKESESKESTIELSDDVVTFLDNQ